LKIAFFSDVHGNYKALIKCLEHAKEHGADKYIFLGDYLGEYAYPQKTMELLYKLKAEKDCIFIRGNKEDYCINYRNNVNCEWKAGNHSIQAMLYDFNNLKPADIDFFETLPISQSVKYEGMEPILVCHGAPCANNTKMKPNDEKTKEIISGCEEKYIVCGHTHEQGVIMSGEKTALNAGAVGVSLHAKGNTQYMLMTSNGSEWDYEFVSLPYDVEDVINDLHESGLWDMTPYWCRVTAHLMRTGEAPHGTVLSEVMRLNGCKDPWYNIDESYWEEALRGFGIE